MVATSLEVSSSMRCNFSLYLYHDFWFNFSLWHCVIGCGGKASLVVKSHGVKCK